MNLIGFDFDWCLLHYPVRLAEIRVEPWYLLQWMSKNISKPKEKKQPKENNK